MTGVLKVAHFGGLSTCWSIYLPTRPRSEAQLYISSKDIPMTVDIFDGSVSIH